MTHSSCTGIFVTPYSHRRHRSPPQPCGRSLRSCTRPRKRSRITSTHSSLSKSCSSRLEMRMSELVNETATDSDTPASDAQVYVVGVRLSPRLASRSSSYRVEGKWLRFGDVCL